MSSEAVIQQNIRLALGMRDDIFMFRINVGVFRPLHGDQKRAIRSAPDGTPDLLGVKAMSVPSVLDILLREELSPTTMMRLCEWIGEVAGQAFAIEVKAARGQQREAQKNWQKAWEKRGGIYVLARSVEDVYKGLDISPDADAYNEQR